jgi:hypothetical protein
MRRIVLAFLILSATFVSKAQNLDSTLFHYANDYNQERTYLHYDKSTYVAGETIWFKAYMMTGILPSEDSRNFYIDWTDEKGNLLSHTVHPIVDAVTNGQFAIPLNYTGTYLHVRAYTKWMLNFDSSFLYNHDIRILSQKPVAASAQQSAAVASLEFFAEGGDPIAGVMNRIAFKANDQWGRPQKIKGVVKNSKGTIVDSLRVKHDGMGSIFLIPEPGENYTATWKDEKNVQHTTALPASRNDGIAMQVTASEGKRTIVLNTANKNIGMVYMIGTMSQHQVFKVSRDMSSGTAKAIVPVKDLPSGILLITIFDKNWTAIAERISFIDNGEYVFSPTMDVEHWGLNKRARNELKITIPDSLVANLSVAITDIGIDADSSNNIISHLLLTSEIKGQVYRPSYYFSNNDDTTKQNLDLVMLTHGWRRFKWEDVVKGKYPTIGYPHDTSYLTLSGRVYGVLPQQLRDAGNIIIMTKPKTGQGQLLVLPVNANGKFEDPDLLLFDSVRIYYQLSKAKGMGDASAQFMENLLPPPRYQLPARGYFNNQAFDTAGNYRHYLLGEEAASLIRRAEGEVLTGVTVTATKKTPIQILDEKYASGMFAGDAKQFDLINDPRAATSFNIFQYLQAQVAGLQVNTTSTPPTMTWRGGSPQLYLDEFPTDAETVANMPVSNIAYVKVFRPPFMGGINGGNGGIAIYTRRGDDVKPEPGKGLNSSNIRGYTQIKEFYSPNYSSFKPENDKRDIRTTLYWNPQVITTPQQHTVTLTFYNNDVSKAFRVIIEGMSQGGRLTHIEQTME